MIPFLTFYIPTFQRPRALMQCVGSIWAQTLGVAGYGGEVDYRIFPDMTEHGLGVAGMYARIPRHASAMRGHYVHLLADDDVLASPLVCEQVKAIAFREQFPPVLIVRAVKGNLDLPYEYHGPPVEGRIDLGCLITRADVWVETVRRGGYGLRYEGDYDFAKALWDAGHRFMYCPQIVFLRGGVSRGAPEAAAA